MFCWRESCSAIDKRGPQGVATVGLLNHMRLSALLFTAILVSAGASAQEPLPSSSPSSTPAAASSAQDAAALNLPVSLERIRSALEQAPDRPLLSLKDQPVFRVEVQERNRLQELLATLDFRSGPMPAGGIYAAEMQRMMFPATNNPLVQPYAAFNQPELLTILIENLVGKYLGGRAINAVTAAERAQAEAAARAEVRHAIADYCSVLPHGGAGVKICSNQTQ